MSAYLGKDKLVYDVTATSDSDNVGAFVRAGTDGQPIGWTNVGLTFAQFVGQVAGMTTDVTITADVAGTVGNITLIADSTSTIAQLVAAWNIANPANTVTITAGIDTQVPTANIVLSGGNNGKDGLDVNVINTLAINDPANYAEDSAHTSGDIGKFVMAVRHDADTSLVTTDGDYAPLQVNAAGRLKVDAIFQADFDFVYAEDSAHTSGDPGAFTLGVRQDALAASVTTDGDYGAFKLNDRGAMWVAPVGTVADDAADTENPVKVGSRSEWGVLAAVSATNDRADLVSDKYRRVYVNNGANISIAPQPISVLATATALPAAPLAGRRQLLIQNLHNKPIYVGDSGVTAASGLRVAAGATITLEAGQDVVVYAIADTGVTAPCRVLELA